MRYLNHGNHSHESSENFYANNIYSTNHKHKNYHSILMIVCCLLPLVGIIAINYFNIKNRYLAYFLFLLCPLSHMMMSISEKREKHK
ncbi:hypothetical protein [Clostridium kluyveri]|uniref:hypothetical protein n=1 Tax=Clostridium kluyveri TaxID=1534 RepID=UPI00224821E7|nr:hypothetical protein [Clostridium kluyveri]UZQ51206.1 hypothetical protein OP486_03250 [Clostridium kluyveri]